MHVGVPSITEEAILKQFEPVLDSIQITEDFAKEIADALNAAGLEAKAARKREAAGLEGNLSKLEHREDELYADLKRGVLDDPMYQRQIGHVREERQRLLRQKEAATEEVNDALGVTAQVVLELCTRAKTLWLSRSPAE
jgi:hypothetical protein